MSRTLKIALGLVVGLVALLLAVQGPAWWVAYRQQEASSEAATLVAAGELEEAKAVLVEAWDLDRDNTELREQIREVNQAMIARDSRKAHVLHGREGPGGELEPEDLLP